MANSADPATIAGYHAHIYYDPAATRDAAGHLREAIGARFPQTRIGSWHDEPVGPHGVAMYQVVFAVDDFPRLVPWLMLNRGGLNVLVHPETGDAYADHTARALWLGAPQPLRTEILRRAH
jgi:aromatic ring-cleaving dioxygenase